MIEGQDFRIRIPVAASDADDGNSALRLPSVPRHVVDAFRQDGFIICPDVLSDAAVDLLNDRLEDVLRGKYDRGKPDKTPRLIKLGKPTSSNNSSAMDRDAKGNQQQVAKGPIGFNGNLENVKVLQVINMHKADSVFRKLETDPGLGSLVAQLGGWEAGARLGQDQVWAKPPGASPLVFHRDSPYFKFEPDDVITVWLALDDMDDELGPLEYVKGSHNWGDERNGSTSQFFDKDAKRMLHTAARQEGIEPDSLEIVSMAGLKRGAMSIHHGKTWHGSGKNTSATKPRRGLGMHFVPANVRFTADASFSKLWSPYIANVEDPSTVELPKEDFPITFET